MVTQYTINSLLSNVNSNTNIVNNFLPSLSQYGFFNIILPFLLIFSISYMIIELTGLLRTNNNDVVGRRLGSLFSFSFALMSMANKSLIVWLYSFIPNASIVILGFFLLAMVIGITGKKIPGFARALMAFLVIGIILWLSLNALKVGGNSSSIVNPITYVINYLFQSGLLTIIIIILILVAILAWATGGSKQEEEEQETKVVAIK